MSLYRTLAYEIAPGWMPQNITYKISSVNGLVLANLRVPLAGPRSIPSYTTGKKYGIFFISAILCIFVEFSFLWCFGTWNTFLRADITFGGVNFRLAAKWSAKVQKQLFRYFFSIRLWLEFLLSLCRLLPYPFVCCIEILCIISLFIYHLFWCGQQGISVVSASHRRTGRVVLV